MVKCMHLGRFLYFGDFVLCPLVAFGLLIATLIQRDATALGLWLAAFVFGCMVWTLVEYIIHRWVYHAVPVFDKLHDAHHQEPRGMIGAPSFLSVGVFFYLYLTRGAAAVAFFFKGANVNLNNGFAGATMHVYGSLIFLCGAFFSSPELIRNRLLRFALLAWR